MDVLYIYWMMSFSAVGLMFARLEGSMYDRYHSMYDVMVALVRTGVVNMHDTNSANKRTFALHVSGHLSHPT